MMETLRKIYITSYLKIAIHVYNEPNKSVYKHTVKFDSFINTMIRSHAVFFSEKNLNFGQRKFRCFFLGILKYSK